MDSKLVVEQMSGRWKIKHPDMRPLAMEANRLAPFGTTYTWVPREQNTHADRLANEALDGSAAGSRSRAPRSPRTPPRTAEATEAAEETAAARLVAARGPPTTLVLVRHGVTAHTAEKRFSGGLGGDNPGLTDEGRDQVRATAEWLAPLGDRRRRRGVLAGAPHPRVGRDPRRGARPPRRGRGRLRGDGVRDLGRADVRRGGRAAQGRAGGLARLARRTPRRAASRSARWRSGCSPACDRVLAEHAGKTIVVVSHVTPIKTLVAHALDAPLQSVLPDGAGAGLGDGADLLRGRPAGRQPMASMRLSTRSRTRRPSSPAPAPRSSTGARWLSARVSHDSRRRRTSSRVTTSAGCGVVRARRSSRGRVRTSASLAGVRGSRPSSSRARTRRPLVALLKWLTTWRLPATSCSTRTVATCGASVGRRPPERGVRAGPEVDQQPGAERLRDGLAERVAPDPGHRADAGEHGVAGEPVRRDPVARAHQAEQAAGDRDPAAGAPLGRGGERGEAERVVEDAGVDPVGAGGRRRVDAGVEGDQVALGPADRPRTSAARSGSFVHRSTRASRTASRASVSTGKLRVATSRGLPRRGAALPSLGGSRISTDGTLVSDACRATEWSG